MSAIVGDSGVGGRQSRNISLKDERAGVLNEYGPGPRRGGHPGPTAGQWHPLLQQQQQLLLPPPVRSASAAALAAAASVCCH